MALVAGQRIAYLGHKDTAASDRLRRALPVLLEDTGQRHRLSAAGADLVDGQGARTIIQAMQFADGTMRLAR